MINFTPASFLTALIYLVCFQLFLSSGSQAWLYTGNMLLFAVTATLFFLYQAAHATICLRGCAKKGMHFSFLSGVITLAGSAVLLLLHSYMNPSQQNAAASATQVINLMLKDAGNFSVLLFTNSFLINVVSGSLASLFIAGMVNERNYLNSAKPLPSVK